MSCNINVCCRIRQDESTTDRIQSNPYCVHIDGKPYNFDKVFDNSTQEDIYEKIGLPFLHDLFHGYNCTIFTYGQTGSGKTYTMQGEGDQPGLVPRLVTEIFDKISKNKSAAYKVSISYVEIYMEKIRDLLEPNQDNLLIREGGPKQGFWIENVTEQKVLTAEKVLALYQEGTKNRVIGETKMNQKSSRSHSVFFINIHQHHPTDNTEISSKLVLVDLAGSEKVSRTGASGILLKQAQFTNKSLTYLGMVIRSLTEKHQHVPYRDSKLTKILRDSLGGNSKTCLIITISPKESNIVESISTLGFGTRVKTIRNKPRPNIEKTTDEYKKELVQAYCRIEELEKHIIGQTLSNYERKIMERDCQIALLNEKLIQDQNLIRFLESKAGNASVCQIAQSYRKFIRILEESLKDALDLNKLQQDRYEDLILSLRSRITNLQNLVYKLYRKIDLKA